MDHKQELKIKRDLLHLYHSIYVAMEESDPAVDDFEVIAKLKGYLDDLESIIEEVTAAMEHHNRLNPVYKAP